MHQTCSAATHSSAGLQPAVSQHTGVVTAPYPAVFYPTVWSVIREASRLLIGVRTLALVGMVFAGTAIAHAADEYAAVLERLAPDQPSAVQTPAELSRADAGASEIERTVIAQAGAEAEGPLPATRQEKKDRGVAWTIVLLLPGLLVATKMLGYVWIGVVTVRDTFRDGVPPSDAQEPAPGETGPTVPESGASEMECVPPPRDRLQEFLELSARQVTAIGELVRSLDVASAGEEQHAVISELCAAITSLKAAADKADLQPVWQMAAALENLLKYVTERQREITSSTIQTITDASQVLSQMCLPGLDPDITIDPPIRFLAVDDDEIGRHSVFLALKKVLREPDLASDGPGALKLVETNRYDVIFLDIEMPGMDGFEVCARIRKTHLNCATPVVFVTYHSDENSREKVMSVGAQELVSKPFVISELSVKALTLVLQSRLRSPDNVLSSICRSHP